MQFRNRNIKSESKNLYEIKMRTNVERFKSEHKRKLRDHFRLNLASTLQARLDTQISIAGNKAVTSHRLLANEEKKAAANQA